MARTVRNAKLDSRSARSRLAQRREPYWTVLMAGCALGYRRGKNGGTWIGRWRDPAGRQSYTSLGSADDAFDANGDTVLAYGQAQERAREFFEQKAQEARGELSLCAGPYTVAHALAEYFEAQRRKGAKGADKDEKSANARILPELGMIEVSSLTPQKLRRWHEDLATKPKLVRTRRGADKQSVKAPAGGSEDMRARRATANRVLTILKAALNLAYHDGRIRTDEGWRKVKPFKAVDAAKLRYLTPDECRRLIAASPPDFASLVRAALLTGCRYGELTGFTVSDVNLVAGTILVRESKGGRPRHVVLTDEGRALLRSLVEGRGPNELVFLKANKTPWKASHQLRPMAKACAAAGINPPATFHMLRHTHGSALAMAGVPMGVIAKQLGHADSRITERHYAHLAPSYVADTIRANLPSFGALELD